MCGNTGLFLTGRIPSIAVADSPRAGACHETQRTREAIGWPCRPVFNIQQEHRQKVVQTADIEEALSRAWELAGPEDLICIAGSLYLVGAARKELLGEVVG